AGWALPAGLSTPSGPAAVANAAWPGATQNVAASNHSNVRTHRPALLTAILLANLTRLTPDSNPAHRRRSPMDSCKSFPRRWGAAGRSTESRPTAAYSSKPRSDTSVHSSELETRFPKHAPRY